MDSSRGAITFCYGPERYVDQAKALARSIRHRSRGISLAVATDRPAIEFADLFDFVIDFDFSAWPGTSAKLALAEISPFDVTLFIDSDSLCIRRIEPLFDYFGTAEFAVFGANRPDFAWADGSPHIRSIVDAAQYPAFNGGLYFFRRSALARDVFARARQFGADYDALGLNRPRGRHNDELLISLAMADCGLLAQDSSELVPMVAPELPARDLELDLLGGHCRFARRGNMVEPELIHFVGSRDRLAAYQRERWVLKLIVDGGWPRWTRPMLDLAARAQHLTRRIVGLLQRLLVAA